MDNEYIQPAKPFLIGLLGSFVALRGAPGASWKERFFNIISGSLIAGFTAPAIAEYFGLTSHAMHSATAFVVGLFGLNLTASIVEWIKVMKLSDLLIWKK